MKISHVSIFITTLLLSTTSSMAQTDPGEEYLARRGNGEVTVHEFDAHMARYPEKDHSAILRDPKRMIDILRNMLMTSQLASDAREQDYQNTPYLAARMRIAAEGELATAWMEHYLEIMPAADYASMAEEIYLAENDRFYTDRMLDVTHLLISTRKRNEESAREIVDGLWARVQDDPSIFSELVTEYSEDSSVLANKGMFTEVEPGDMVESFDEAAFAIENVGDFSEPVLSPFGFHIIRLDGTHEPRKLTFEQVKQQLMNRARYEHLERHRNMYLTDLAAIEVDINNDAMQRVLRKYVGDPSESQVAEDSANTAEELE